MELGALLPAWSILPFLGILLSIALFPLVAPHTWHRHYPKVSLAWGLLLIVPFVWVYGHEAVQSILHTAVADYLPFIILLAALFTIGGGIYLRGALRGTPWVNAGILLAGTLLASWVGTTGAAMVLIRLLLRANAHRARRAHTVVFFIFLVANIGGALTPLGDPPLFLGFLRGVPFFWTFRLAPEMLLAAALVLAVYVVWDFWLWNRERPEVRHHHLQVHAKHPEQERLRIEGAHNIVFLAGVLAAVILSGVWHPGAVRLFGISLGIESLVRDALILVMLAASWLTTPQELHKANGFSWSPVKEVAILFAAIFTTIIPALEILKAGGHGALGWLIRGVKTPAEFFWATGILSSFLDNAPTYLAFLSSALGQLYPAITERQAILHLIAEHGAVLKAIATGAVFMGANTYLGNAPNLMVKAIAEKTGVEMPSFLGYMKYSVLVLVPVFLVVTWLFY
ncbi:MAG TPA: sodium:proton antiporter [Thermoanaerobaculia bacterium]|jgi:Na+/H+ antiporter NhaD/arsenite permease-like protein|nr:sodium:proton antiporter [Thermoanaerobaculia bacterium]